MIKTADGTEIYENQIEELFIQYCEDNNIQGLEERHIQGEDATDIWLYIYSVLFKPEKKLLNNRKSKLDYGDIETIYQILDIYKRLCFRYKIFPMIEDFSYLTGINRDTFYSWEKGEHRVDSDTVTCKHSDILKNIREMADMMLAKGLFKDPIGRQSLANNYKGSNLQFNRANMQDQLDIFKPMERPAQIAQRRQKAPPTLPDFATDTE